MYSPLDLDVELLEEESETPRVSLSQRPKDVNSESHILWATCLEEKTEEGNQIHPIPSSKR